MDIDGNLMGDLLMNIDVFGLNGFFPFDIVVDGFSVDVSDVTSGDAMRVIGFASAAFCSAAIVSIGSSGTHDPVGVARMSWLQTHFPKRF